MYTLRTLTQEGHQSNLALGNNYSFIPRETAPEAFARVYVNAYQSKEMVIDGTPNEDCYGMIQSELINFIFLWKGEWNYIMTENGKTFSNLSHRMDHFNVK